MVNRKKTRPTATFVPFIASERFMCLPQSACAFSHHLRWPVSLPVNPTMDVHPCPRAIPRLQARTLSTRAKQPGAFAALQLRRNVVLCRLRTEAPTEYREWRDSLRSEEENGTGMHGDPNGQPSQRLSGARTAGVLATPPLSRRADKRTLDRSRGPWKGGECHDQSFRGCGASEGATMRLNRLEERKVKDMCIENGCAGSSYAG